MYVSAYEIAIAFAVGFASFLSPCILPIVPGFIASLSAGTLPRNGGDMKKAKKIIFLNTLYFVLGLALTFSLIGTLLNCLCTPGSVVGLQLKSVIAYAGGFVIVGFGAFLLLTAWIPRLNFQKILLPQGIQRRTDRAHASYVLSWVAGATFAAGWTPCVGPLLGSVLALAASQPAAAYNSLLAYSLGLGIPFIIIGAFFTTLTPVLKRISKWTKYFDIVMGTTLIVIGIVFIINQSL